jgi:ATP-dependent DNA ligase
VAVWATRPRTSDLPFHAGFIQPCQAVLSSKAPSGPEWVHEIKHDGYRILARREGDLLRLWSRNGRDWSDDLRSIAFAIRRLSVTSVVLDGEAVAHDADGLPDFFGLRRGEQAARAHLFAFDLLELNGEDLRTLPLIDRKARLERLLRRAPGAVTYVEHLDADGPTMFKHACQLGLEGIVSKRRRAPYRSGPDPNWLKIKNASYARR